MDVVSIGYVFVVIIFSGRVFMWGDFLKGGDSLVVQFKLFIGVIKVVGVQYVFMVFKNDGSIVIWGRSNYLFDVQKEVELYEMVLVMNNNFFRYLFVLIDGGVF